MKEPLWEFKNRSFSKNLHTIRHNKRNQEEEEETNDTSTSDLELNFLSMRHAAC